MKRRFGLVVICFGLAIACCGGSLWVYGFLKIFSPDEINQTSNWNKFYKETFSQHFWIPEEATIVSATQIPDSFMGERDRVIFRLPNTRTPSQWVRLIAEKSKIGQYQQTDIWYDASHGFDGRTSNSEKSISELYFIRYDPEIEQYEAVFEWD